MRYSWDPAQPVGGRVTGIQVSDGAGGYTQINPSATYRLVVNNFIAGGGDGYAVLTRGTNVLNTGFLDSDVLAEYISANSPVSAQVEGRIVQAGVLPGAAAAPGAGAPTPAALPRTGGDISALWLLAALGAGAIGSGLRLRRRAAKAEPAEAAEEEVVA
jgi:5'-nucleotidase